MEPWAPMSSGGGGIGFNRATWNAGRALGKEARRAWNYLKSQGAGEPSRPTKKIFKSKIKLPLRVAVRRSGPRRGLVRQEGSSTSKTVCNFGSRKGIGGRLYKLSAPQFYVRNEAGSNVQSTAGAQSSYNYAYNHYTILNAIKALCPNTPVIPSRFLFESLNAEHFMANSASFGCSVTIYDIMCRRDTPVNAFDPLNCFINGLSNEGGSGTSYQTVGATPLQSEQFNQFFKVVQTTYVDVPSGGTHRHVVNFTPNKLIHGEVVTSLSGNNVGSLKDFGIFTLFVFHGQPAHDSTTTTSVTLSASSLDIVTKISCKFRYSQESSSDWNRSNNLANSFAVGPQFVNDLVGQTQDATGLHPTILIS
jgi:hypothetical protein